MLLMRSKKITGLILGYWSATVRICGR